MLVENEAVCLCDKIASSKTHFFIELFLALVIVAFALALCMQLVVRSGLVSSKKMPIKYFTACTTDGLQTRFIGDKSEYMMGAVTRNKIMFDDGQMVKTNIRNQTRIYGTILSIDNNQLVLKNNAATEQTVVSQADTMIFASSTEIGLASLQVGQNLIVHGELGDDNIITAQIINIQ